MCRIWSLFQKINKRAIKCKGIREDVEDLILDYSEGVNIHNGVNEEKLSQNWRNFIHGVREWKWYDKFGRVQVILFGGDCCWLVAMVVEYHSPISSSSQSSFTTPASLWKVEKWNRTLGGGHAYCQCEGVKKTCSERMFNFFVNIYYPWCRLDGI